MKSKSSKIFSGLLALILALTMMVGVMPMSAGAASYNYNPSAAASYAIKYAYDYNTSYTSYKGKGGDCANFVSQCLYNGGIAKTANWKPDSYQWINCGGLKSFLCSTLGCTYISQPSASQISVGDVMYYNNGSHVCIVSAIENGVPKVCGHTTDTRNGSYKQGYSTYGVIKLTRSITHTINSSYGRNFTAYPKSKITAGNIFDANHNQISSTAWIGTSDKCTIHEVYTDGCCKVSYPLDSGGTKTVYSKISLFKSSSHYHSYDTFVYYQAAHPHYNCYKCSCGEIIVRENETNYVSTCNECCKSTDSNWNFSDYDLPSISNLSSGSDYNIKGTVSSSITINWVGIVIYNDADEEIAQANAYPGALSYNIDDLNDQIDFSALPTGKYRILVHANNAKDDYKYLYYEYFNVGAPVLAAPEINIKTTSAGKAIFSWVAVPNADCYDVRIYNSNKESYKNVWGISDTSYEIELPDGDYYVWVCAANSKFYSCYTYGSFMDFSIKNTLPEKPKLKNLKSEYSENDLIKFEWDATERTTHYNLYLKKLNEDTNEYEIYDYEMHYVESGYERVLPAGKYRIMLQSTNSDDWSYTDGDWTEFTVYKNYIVKYDANGGSNAPATQTKTHDVNLTLSSGKPTGKSFTISYNTNGGNVSPSSKTVSQTFLNWNTAANGSGTTYTAGKVYAANASITLYAQYSSPSIGSLPTPTRSGYSFDGWYTAANGGTRIIDSAKVTVNTTIYAHWSCKHVSTAIKNAKAATCTAKGYTGDTYCLGCGVTTVKGKDIAAKGHSWSSWQTVTAPTVDSKGLEKRVCSKCGAEETRVISKLEPVQVVSVELDTAKKSLNIGDTFTLTATVKPNDATDKSVTWSSSDTSVATVDEKGVVTAVSEGTATITATASNGVKADCAVTVKQKGDSIFKKIFDVILAPFRAIINLFKKLLGK